MTDDTLINEIPPDKLRRLQDDLATLLKYGYGQIIIEVNRGHVVGHKLVVNRNYCIYKKDP